MENSQKPNEAPNDVNLDNIEAEFLSIHVSDGSSVGETFG